MRQVSMGFDLPGPVPRMILAWGLGRSAVGEATSCSQCTGFAGAICVAICRLGARRPALRCRWRRAGIEALDQSAGWSH